MELLSAVVTALKRGLSMDVLRVEKWEELLVGLRVDKRADYLAPWRDNSLAQQTGHH